MEQVTGVTLMQVCDEVERRMIGQRDVIEQTVAACIAGGHVLLQDVPGTGKTTLASSVADVMGLHFSRVQGTPDLLPSDITGSLVFHPNDASFHFRPGPVFTHLLLMDEINRATPRTQSALLEAMAENQVTVEGDPRQVERPFFVIATANPIESQGVFPLPEAQLDRFLVQLRLGYVTEEEEIELVQRIRIGANDMLQPLMTVEQVIRLQAQARSVTVANDVIRYIVRLCRATREHESVTLGASPRSILHLTAHSQALALLANRNYVIPDDVQRAWIPVMRHRIRTKVEWSAVGDSAEVLDVLRDVVAQIMTPTEVLSES